MPHASASTRNHLGTPPTPIFKLHRDMLWFIFSLNADMESLNADTEQDMEIWIPPLDTLRYTSQVCSDWRTLVIGSPSLWARLLDFNYLSQNREEWRKEVVGRTGTAPVHIKWQINGNDTETHIEEFFRQMVDENWPRIQSLDLCFYIDIQDAEHEHWLRILQRPAPSLKVFSCDLPLQDLPRADFVLLANQAPSLTNLFTHNIHINLTALSIPNIRRLNLDLHPAQASEFEFLDALREMSLLEELYMTSNGPIIRSGNKDRPLPQIILPRLTDIGISENEGVTNTLSLLAQIIPAKNCILGLSSAYHDKFPDDASLQLYCSVLSRYSEYFTELGSAICLDVHFSDMCFGFSLPHPSRRFFFVKIESRLWRFNGNAIPILLSALTTVQLDKIKKSAVRFGIDALSMLSNPDSIDFILALGSVEELTTDCRTLRAFALIQPNTMVVIPSLKTIDLGRVNTEHDLFCMKSFFDERVKLGFPVDGITLKIKPLWFNIDILEGVQGLTIEVDPSTTVEY